MLISGMTETIVSGQRGWEIVFHDTHGNRFTCPSLPDKTPIQSVIYFANRRDAEMAKIRAN